MRVRLSTSHEYKEAHHGALRRMCPEYKTRFVYSCIDRVLKFREMRKFSAIETRAHEA